MIVGLELSVDRQQRLVSPLGFGVSKGVEDVSCGVWWPGALFGTSGLVMSILAYAQVP